MKQEVKKKNTKINNMQNAEQLEAAQAEINKEKQRRYEKMNDLQKSQTDLIEKTIEDLTKAGIATLMFCNVDKAGSIQYNNISTIMPLEENGLPVSQEDWGKRHLCDKICLDMSIIKYIEQGLKKSGWSFEEYSQNVKNLYWSFPNKSNV